MSCCYQAIIILHLNRPRVHYGAEFSDCVRRVLWGRILRGRHGDKGMRLRNRLDGEQLYRGFSIGPIEWRSEHDETIHDIVT